MCLAIFATHTNVYDFISETTPPETGLVTDLVDLVSALSPSAIPALPLSPSRSAMNTRTVANLLPDSSGGAHADHIGPLLGTGFATPGVCVYARTRSLEMKLHSAEECPEQHRAGARRRPPLGLCHVTFVPPASSPVPSPLILYPPSLVLLFVLVFSSPQSIYHTTDNLYNGPSGNASCSTPASVISERSCQLLRYIVSVKRKSFKCSADTCTFASSQTGQ